MSNQKYAVSLHADSSTLLVDMRKRIKKIAFFIIIATILIIELFPLVVILSVSLKELGDVFHSPATWIPRPFKFRNYIDVWDIIPVGKLFFNSVIVTFSAILFIMVISIPAAYAFSRLDFYGKKVVHYITLVSQMFAPVIVIIPLFQVMSRYNIVNSHLSLIISNTAFNVAFIILLIKAFFDSVPNEVVESSTIDGCGKFGTLIRIFVPMSTSALVVAVIFAFTRTWNEFLFAYTFISSADKELLVVGLYKILKANPSFDITWNFLMVGAVYAMIPIQILFMSIKKYIVRGISAGSIK